MQPVSMEPQEQELATARLPIVPPATGPVPAFVPGQLASTNLAYSSGYQRHHEEAGARPLIASCASAAAAGRVIIGRADACAGDGTGVVHRDPTGS